eukprot:m.79146 g.79146  ORF g.79146 m.79146 type:complete len:66 (+) comp17405_c0_seq3:51-248(+)
MKMLQCSVWTRTVMVICTVRAASENTHPENITLRSRLSRDETAPEEFRVLLYRVSFSVSVAHPLF